MMIGAGRCPGNGFSDRDQVLQMAIAFAALVSGILISQVFQ
jgi:hypothetical protein